jgi:TRAP-type C4-dicarboxylate transport system permease small subunit
MLPRLSREINRGVESGLFVLGAAIAIVVAAQVFSRYVLNHSLFWSEELARFLLIWLTFLGATAAYRRRVHPGIDLFTRHLPPVSARWLAAAIHLCSLLFFLLLIVYGTRFAWFVRLQVTPALQVPKWIVFAVVPLSGWIFVLHGLARLTGDARGKAP